MTKIYMIAAVASMMMVGCQNENIVAEMSNEGEMFTLEVNQGTESRTEWGQDGATLWSNDDKIYVTSEDGTVTGVLTYQGGNSFKGFVYGGDASKLTHVLYPVPENGQIKINQPTGNKIGLPMMGELNNNKTGATLDNLCALVQMPVDGADKLTLGDKGGMLTGHYEYNDGEIVFVPGEGEVVISVVDGSALFATSTHDEDGNVVSEVEFTVKGSEETYVVPVTQGQIETEDVPNIEISGGKVDATMNVTTPEILEMALNQYDEVKLAGNITIEKDITIAAERNITLDLNGYALAGNIINNGVLTVINTEISLENVSSFEVSGGTTYIQGGTYNYSVTPAQGFAAISVDEEYIVLPAGSVIVKDADELEKAVATGNTSLYLLQNESGYDVNKCGGKTFTLTGIGVVILKIHNEGESGCDYGFDHRIGDNSAVVTFNNIVFNTPSATYPGYARMNAVYNYCTFNGQYTLYGNSTFNNCIFDISGDLYNLWTWGAPTATFSECTFNCDGKAVLLYGRVNTKLTMNDCTFNDNGGLTDLKAAIEIGNDYNKSYELIVNDATVNGFEINDKGINTGTTLWANKNSMGTDKLNVVVDGEDVY